MSAETTSQTLGEVAADTGTTDRLSEADAPDREPRIVDTATNSKGEVLLLEACPSCGKPFYDISDVENHLRARDPDHFGITGEGYHGISPGLMFDMPEAVLDGDDEGVDAAGDIRETGAQIDLLTAIRNSDEATSNDIAESVDRSARTVSDSIGRLRRNGYVKIVGESGQVRGREYCYALTEEGEDLVNGGGAE